MSASKARGTAHETAIVNYLKVNGFPLTERRALSGNKDRGDIAGVMPGLVIEAKSQNRISLAEWVDEAEVEGRNDGADLAVVWAKRKGKGSVGDGYVVMTGRQFVDLLHRLTERP